MFANSESAEQHLPWLGAWRNKPEAYDLAAAEVARLGWLYVSRFSKERQSESLIDFLALLGHSDLAFLKALRFMQSDPVIALLRSAPSLAFKLPQSARNSRETVHEIRGRIDWPATIRERCSQGANTSLFVVTRSDRNTDTPEARALAYILDRIASAGRVLARNQEMAECGLAAERILSNAALKTTRVPRRLSGIDRQAIRMSRLVEFRNEVSDAVILNDALATEDFTALRALLGDRVWLPPEADKLFELWVLFSIVRSLEGAGWEVTRLRLLGANGGRSSTFVMRSQGSELHLGYQAAPFSFVKESRYKRLLDIYSIAGSLRRPDILISAPGSAGTLHMFVEAKLTDNRDYVADSIYKVFGYLTDFQVTLSKSPDPKGVLVVWGGITQVTGLPEAVSIFGASSISNGSLVPIIESLSRLANDSSA